MLFERFTMELITTDINANVNWTTREGAVSSDFNYHLSVELRV